MDEQENEFPRHQSLSHLEVSTVCQIIYSLPAFPSQAFKTQLRHHFLGRIFPDPMMSQLPLLCAPPNSICSHPFTAICALFCNFLLTCLNMLLTRILVWLL